MFAINPRPRLGAHLMGETLTRTTGVQQNRTILVNGVNIVIYRENVKSIILVEKTDALNVKVSVVNQVNQTGVYDTKMTVTTKKSILS